LRQRRAQAQSRVVREIERLTSSVLWTEMQQPLQELSTRSKLRGIKKDSRVLRAQARSAISGGIDAMLALERFVPQAEKTEEHHQMRIAAKKLRYTLEIFSPLYESGFKESLDSAKETQKRLGEIHDCDVWVQFLNDFLEQERERTVEYFGHDQLMQRLAPGIEFLRQDRAALRATAYQEFVAFWNEARQKNTWDELRRSIAVRAATQSGKDPAAASEQAPAENTNRPIQV
jgi:CHAD domain-containing protein